MAASPPGFRMETCFDSQELWKLYKGTIINMAVAQNSLSQKRPFLAKRKNYFSDFSEKFPKSTKTFAARDLGLCVGIYVAKKTRPRQGTSRRLLPCHTSFFGT